MLEHNMNYREVFLQAICDHPEDHSLKFAFADFLQEQGDISWEAWWWLAENAKYPTWNGWWPAHYGMKHCATLPFDYELHFHGTVYEETEGDFHQAFQLFVAEFLKRRAAGWRPTDPTPAETAT